MNSNFNQKRGSKHSKISKKGPNKSLGQHWLRDREILDEIADSAEINQDDFVLEIGPGLGTLTSSILKLVKNGKVLCVEFDANLAEKLPLQFPGKNLEIINADFLNFNLNDLPKDYKVAANVPYYITSKIIEKLLTAKNKPIVSALLVQKEVAARLAAETGEMSILAISAQIFAKVSLGEIVPREFFTPPPKVDSQIVIFHTRNQNLLENFNEVNCQNITEKQLFQVIKAGFSAKRKKIHKSLGANLGLPKDDILQILEESKVSPEIRAQDLTIENWFLITKEFQKLVKN